MKGEVCGQEYEVNGFYFDYRCRKCNQEGTARFDSKFVDLDDDGRPNPKKTVYCCECKSDDVEIEESGDY